MRRSGFTLTEVLISLIIIFIFFTALMITFDVVTRSYDVNKTAVLRLYAEANIDNLFNIIEEELRYAGSMKNLLKLALDSSGTVINATDNTVRIEYALSEKIILKKEENDDYKDYPIITDSTNTYFALFASKFPEVYNNSLWALYYDNLDDPATDIIQFINISKADSLSVTENLKATVIDAKNKDGISPASSEVRYISPFSYISTDTILKNSDGKTWYGENAYVDTIYSTFTNDSTIIVMDKYIPTIESTFTIYIADAIKTFDIEKNDDGNYFEITVEYVIHSGNFFAEEKIFEKNRIFFY